MGSPTTIEDDIVHRFLKFDLSTGEDEGVTILNEDFRIGQEECQRSLIGKIHGERKASFQGLKNTIIGLWNFKEEIRVRELGHNLFQFILPTKEACQKILAGRSWTFDNQFLVLKQWEAGIEKKPESGSPQGRHIKVQIEVDLDSPLPRGTKLRVDEKVVWIHFKYELLPIFCLYCGRLGHGEKSCVRRQQDAAVNQLKPEQYGDWLRATTKSNTNRANPTNQSSLSTPVPNSLNPLSTQITKAVLQSPNPTSNLMQSVPLSALITQTDPSSLNLHETLGSSSNSNISKLELPKMVAINPDNKPQPSSTQINHTAPSSTTPLRIISSTPPTDPPTHKPVQCLPKEHQIQIPVMQPFPHNSPHSQIMKPHNPNTHTLDPVTKPDLLKENSLNNLPEGEAKSTCTTKETDPMDFSLSYPEPQQTEKAAFLNLPTMAGQLTTSLQEGSNQQISPSYPEPQQSEDGALINIPIVAGQFTTPLLEVNNHQLAIPIASLPPKHKGKWTRRQSPLPKQLLDRI